MLKTYCIIVLSTLVCFFAFFIQLDPRTRVVVAPFAFSNGDMNNPFTDGIITILTWEKMLSTVEENDKTMILWAGAGGWMDVAQMVVTRLNTISATKNVTVLVTGYAGSAHAFAICGLNKAYHTSSALLMFHLPAISKNKIDKFDRKSIWLKRCLDKGILTQEDVKRLTGITPQEVWISYFPDNKPHKTYRPDRRAIANGGTAI